MVVEPSDVRFPLRFDQRFWLLDKCDADLSWSGFYGHSLLQICIREGMVASSSNFERSSLFSIQQDLHRVSTVQTLESFHCDPVSDGLEIHRPHLAENDSRSASRLGFPAVAPAHVPPAFHLPADETSPQSEFQKFQLQDG